MAATAFVWGAVYPAGDRFAPRARPVELPGDAAPVAAVACGYRHTLLATSEGGLYSFGDGAYGQLGRPGAAERPELVPALASEAVVAVAGGGFYSAAVTAGGALYEWGLCFERASANRMAGEAGGDDDGGAGQIEMVGMRLGDRSEFVRRLVLRSEAAYAANRDIADVEVEGTGTGAGAGRAAAPAGGGANAVNARDVLRMRVARARVPVPRLCESLRGVRVTAVAAGYAHTVVIDAAGSLWAAGYNDKGALGTGDRLSRHAYTRVAVAPTPGIAAAAGTTAFRAVACGQQHTLAATVDGRVFTWGSGALGQLGHGDGHDRLTPALVWALRMPAMLSPATNARHTPASLDVNGSRYWEPTFDEGRRAAPAFGASLPGRPAVPPDPDGAARHAVVGVAAGSNHSVVLTATGAVLGFGHSEYNQLGPGGPPPGLAADGSRPGGASGWGDLSLPSSHFYLPRILHGLGSARVVAVAAGGQFTLATLADGSVVSFGYDAYGCLGRGDADGSRRFARVVGLQGRRVTAAACGYNHAAAAVAPDGHPFAAPWARLLDAVNVDHASAASLGDGGGGEDGGLRAVRRDIPQELQAHHDTAPEEEAAAAAEAAARASALLYPTTTTTTTTTSAVDGAGSGTQLAAVAAAASAASVLPVLPGDVLLIGSAPVAAAAASALPAPTAAGTKPGGGMAALRAALNAAIVGMAQRRQRQAVQQPAAAAGGDGDVAASAPLPPAAVVMVDEAPVACHSVLLAARCPALGDAMAAARRAAEGGGGSAAAQVTLPGGTSCGVITVAYASGQWTLRFPGLRRVVLHALAAYLYSDALQGPRGRPLPSHRVRPLAELATVLALPRLARLCDGLSRAYASADGGDDDDGGDVGRGGSAPSVPGFADGDDDTVAAAHVLAAATPADSTFARDMAALLDGAAESGDVEVTLEPPPPDEDGDGGNGEAAAAPAQAAPVVVPLHSLVLCRYEFFQRLLRGGFSEARSVVVAPAEAAAPGARQPLLRATLHDVAPPAFADVVRFLYTGSLAHATAPPERLLEALALGARLCVGDLVAQGQDVVAGMMAPGDAPALADFAATHGLPRLAAACAALQAAPSPDDARAA